MSFEFQSTLVNITPNYRISGSQIGGIRILEIRGTTVARVIVTDDSDVLFSLAPPYEIGNPTDIYTAMSADLYEVAPGVLLNEGAVGSVELGTTQITIDLAGADRPFTFNLSSDPAVVAATETADHTWALPAAAFATLSTAAGMWRSSMDGTLEGLSTAIASEVADRIAAVTGVQADVDQNEADADAAIAAEASTRATADTALSGRLDVLEADPTTATAVAAGDAATLSSANTYTDTAVSNVIGTAPGVLDTLGEIADAINDDANVYTTLVTSIAAVQTDVDGNETDSDAADAALSGRLDTLEADPTTATAVAAVQADVDQNETDSDAADAALSGRLDTLEADPTTATAVAAVQSDVDQNESDADAAIAGEATTRANADTALSGRLDVLEADPTTATAVAAVQADVDQNETDSDAADAALSGRLDTLEADPTTATAVAAVQADVDQNETDGDAADAALSGRLDTLEADPTTATAVAAVQADVDQNEADADAALALKAPLADPDFTGQLDVDTNARIEFADNLTKIHNVLRGTSIDIGNNIEMKPAAAGGRVEITGDLILDFSDMVDAANDGDAATAGVQIGGVYRHNNDLKIRIV